MYGICTLRAVIHITALWVKTHTPTEAHSMTYLYHDAVVYDVK